MAWIIIDATGEAPCDPAGELILVDSEEAAREWLMRDDQRVERFERWMQAAGESDEQDLR